MPILPLPDCIASRLNQGPDEPATDQPTHTIPEGQRHQHMLSLAGRMRRAGASTDAIRAALQAENEARFTPALDDEWVEKIVTWINTRPPGAPGPEGIAKGCPLSDEGNAQRLVTEYGERVRFDSTHKAWRQWDGKRWVLDHKGEVEWLCRQTVSNIHIAAQQETDTKVRDALEKWAHTSEGASRMDAMLKLARSTPDIVLTADDLDGDPYLLNCANGVLDLRTGELHAHDPLRPISKLCPWNYHADAPPPRLWQESLDRFLPDKEVQHWLQVLFGYCLSGLTGEQKLWLLWGSGGNFKSTALEVLRNLLGPDYAQVTDSTLLIEKRPGTATNDVATLHGARAVIVSDLPKGYLDIDFIKRFTGDAKVRARHLYAESFEFTPQGKLLVSCNTRPALNETTNAIKRRLEVSHWPVQIEEDERVRDYYKVLLAEEGESILRWAVQGYGMYQEEGKVPTPKSSSEATQTYYSENDTLRDFLDECCEVGKDKECRFSDLLASLHQWVSEQGMSLRKHNRQWLREELRHHGFKTDQSGSTLIVPGIAVHLPTRRTLEND